MVLALLLSTNHSNMADEEKELLLLLLLLSIKDMMMALGKALFCFFFLPGLLLVSSAAKHKENATSQLPDCKFPAIFNFGDSNSDTGGISAAFFPIPQPNGETFFQKPAGRACDGRLVIDFIAGGSTIRPQNLSLFEGGIGPFSLNVQVVQFSQFQARTTELYRRGKRRSIYNLPKPRHFSKGLYTFDIGQNDLSVAKSMSNDQVLASIPDIINQLYQAVQGCDLDEKGCVKPQNAIAQEFNRQLKDKVTQMRKLLPKAAFIYVDIYSAKYELISIAKENSKKKHGLPGVYMDPLKYCCGRHEEGHYHVNCGEKAIVNGTVLYGGSCDKPSAYVSWDGVHYSHAANQWIADRILNGKFSDPPLPITHACHGSSQ
ncbi:hypothetical protein ACLOJK_015818 [Asimina triloba]